MEYLELDHWKLLFCSEWTKHCLLELLMQIQAKLLMQIQANPPYIHLTVMEEL